ncbi:guanine nucleotide-binding protein subunit alpha [Sorochytrium milnesiophthora]
MRLAGLRCGSSPEEHEKKVAHTAIEKQIARDAQNAQREAKLLLLGAGDSGKSTILKQMHLIYGEGFKATDRINYKDIVLNNTINAFRVLMEGMQRLEIQLNDEETNGPFRDVMLDLPDPRLMCELTPEITAAIKALWQDAGVRATFARSNEFQMIDSAKYYFNDIDRLSQPDYLPSDLDILRSRVMSTGIVEVKFTVDDLTYRVFDVGGQRSERRKWIHCFEDVTAIIFLVAISEYDQQLMEDETVNRLQESLTLFESVCNSTWFARTSIILFLNKVDLFKQKLQYSPPNKYFPQFPPEMRDFENASRFFRAMFERVNKTSQKTIYSHFTCATDTAQVSFVIRAVRPIIQKLTLTALGMM